MSIKKTVIFFYLLSIVLEPVKQLKLVLGNAFGTRLYPDDISPEDFI